MIDSKYRCTFKYIYNYKSQDLASSLAQYNKLCYDQLLHKYTRPKKHCC